MAADGAGNPESGGLVVFTTAGDEESARAIASALVENRLAACVNIVSNVNSIYRWDGKVADDRELLLIVKTWSDRFEALESKILSVHTYDLPEIVALRMEGGHLPYLDWVLKETR